MQTMNGYVQVKPVQADSMILTQDSSVVEVVQCSDSELKTGDKLIFEGKMTEKNVNGETLYFIFEDDIIAVL